jgi:hypothetical protein
VLSYSLHFDSRVTRVEPPHLIDGHATGDLHGVGVWRLFAAPGGSAVLYSWRVRTTRRWINLCGPLAPPAFRWNHDLVKHQGAVGLPKRLSASLLLHDRHAAVAAERALTLDKELRGIKPIVLSPPDDPAVRDSHVGVQDRQLIATTEADDRLTGMDAGVASGPHGVRQRAAVWGPLTAAENQHVDVVRRALRQRDGEAVRLLDDVAVGVELHGHKGALTPGTRWRRAVCRHGGLRSRWGRRRLVLFTAAPEK